APRAPAAPASAPARGLAWSPRGSRQRARAGDGSYGKPPGRQRTRHYTHQYTQQFTPYTHRTNHGDSQSQDSTITVMTSTTGWAPAWGPSPSRASVFTVKPWNESAVASPAALASPVRSTTGARTATGSHSRRSADCLT